MRYYKNNQGFIQPFQIMQADGINPYDLTGATVTWYFKDTSTSPATITSIVGIIANSVLGEVNFTIPSNFFNSVTTYQCQLVITLGSSVVPTDPPFTVTISLGANLAS